MSEEVRAHTHTHTRACRGASRFPIVENTGGQFELRLLSGPDPPLSLPPPPPTSSFCRCVSGPYFPPRTGPPITGARGRSRPNTVIRATQHGRVSGQNPANDTTCAHTSMQNTNHTRILIALLQLQWCCILFFGVWWCRGAGQQRQTI